MNKKWIFFRGICQFDQINTRQLLTQQVVSWSADLVPAWLLRLMYEYWVGSTWDTDTLGGRIYGRETY